MFATKPEAASGHLTVADRISAARANAKEGNVEPDKYAAFIQHLTIIVPSSVALWLLLFLARWRYSDKERLTALSDKPGGSLLLHILGSRILSHFGPYQIPNFTSARLHEKPLQLLEQPLLLDHERSVALQCLEQLSMRRLAAQQFAPPGETASANSPLRSLEPLYLELFANPSTSSDVPASSASHKAAALRIVFDVVSATPAEDRAVPAWVLEGFVMARGSPWNLGPQMEECRLALLLLLLQSPQNCELAATMPTVCSFFQQTGFKQKEDTLLPLKAYLLSGETPDLLRRGARLINKQCPDSIEVLTPRVKRDTPSLQTKHDLRNMWTTVILTGSWAAFRAWRGVADVAALLAIARSCGAALGGMFVLESIWRIEEWIIQSEWYFKESTWMHAGSAGMCLINCLSFSWAFRYSCLVPFVGTRFVKDEFLDAYRVYEDDS